MSCEVKEIMFVMYWSPLALEPMNNLKSAVLHRWSWRKNNKVLIYYEAEKEFHLFSQLLPKIGREIFFFLCSRKQVWVNTWERNYLNRNGLSLHRLFRSINCIWFVNCLIWGFFKKNRLSGKILPFSYLLGKSPCNREQS